MQFKGGKVLVHLGYVKQGPQWVKKGVQARAHRIPRGVKNLKFVI